MVTRKPRPVEAWAAGAAAAAAAVALATGPGPVIVRSSQFGLPWGGHPAPR